MIQSAQVASKFTLFTHHAKTFPNLVTALRNSMLRAGVFKSERTAEEQVVQVLNFNIHLVKDFRGRRYIERITECIPVEERNEYTYDHRNEKTLEGKFTKFFDNATVYFTKTTNRELYKYRNVLEFSNDSYVLVNPISEENIREMRNNMEENDVIAFDKFLERNWGIKPPVMQMTAKEPQKNTKPESQNKRQEGRPAVARPDMTEEQIRERKQRLAELSRRKQEIARNTGAKSAKKPENKPEKDDEESEEE